jgi:hypothetical protein
MGSAWLRHLAAKIGAYHTTNVAAESFGPGKANSRLFPGYAFRFPVPSQ